MVGLRQVGLFKDITIKRSEIVCLLFACFSCCRKNDYYGFLDWEPLSNLFLQITISISVSTDRLKLYCTHYSYTYVHIERFFIAFFKQKGEDYRSIFPMSCYQG